MAYNVTNFTDYVARENATLTKALFAGGDTGKFAMKMAGVKGSTKVPHLSGAATLQAGNCPIPSGSRVATEVTLTVADFTVYEDFCQGDLETKFPNLSLGSNNGDEAVSQWEEVLIETIISSINETLELTYWQGDTAGTYTLFDGFIKQIDAAATAVDGNPTAILIATGIVAANVIGIVEGMYTAASTKVKRSKDFVILMGDDTFDLFIAAQKTANQYHYSAEHDNGVYKLGGSAATIQRVYGLDGQNRLFAGIKSNFIIGADVENEKDVADVWYDKTDDKMYVRVKGKAGVVPANIDEIVEFSLA